MQEKAQAEIGVIGGSGIYQIEGLQNIREVEIDTPFGKPSDSYIIGELEGKKIAFLPRHGRGHRILPSEINYRANIIGFKMLGVTQIISISAVGSMKKEIEPLNIVIPDQLFDRTKLRTSTFFGDGVVAHIAFDKPFCPALSKILYEAASGLGLKTHLGGTYICIEGPQFSTKAESRIYRQWGVDIIGMTGIPEAKLAREAEICYATLALVTDYDVWYEGEEVTAEMVMENMRKNVENAKRVLREAVKMLPYDGSRCTCRNALKNSIVTDLAKVDRKTLEKLRPIISKYIK